jgi:predicted ATPase
MRLQKARIQKYRSIIDTEEFEVEDQKTILVGPNEAGKSAVLQALQQINAPADIPGFVPLRDYPRSLYNDDIATKKLNPKSITVAEAEFTLEAEDKADIPTEFHDCTFFVKRSLGNTSSFELQGGPSIQAYGSLQNDLTRLAAHVDARVPPPAADAKPTLPPSEKLRALSSTWDHATVLDAALAQSLLAWLKEITPLVDEANATEEKRLDTLTQALGIAALRAKVTETLSKRVPLFVLFSNYFRVRPSIHLGHLAQRVDQKILDDKQYDYGNICLLKYLGFTPRQLFDLGNANEPPANDGAALQKYKDQLDERAYQLNAASVRLTGAIREVWVPDEKKAEADKLQISADRQYLKVAVEDDLGVLVELDQRSEGFQWLVSFFVVFFAETAGKHKNAILLLDEPGLSLHGLKQREFRNTISKLAVSNQTLYTTHSPFLVGPDELDLVRVVELTNRKVGTKVHTDVTAKDPAALLPLQEALGYDLAQSLFAQQRNLVLEGLTDIFYLEATSDLLAAASVATLNDKIALIPAKSAGKVVYFATILHAQSLKVAALLDSDGAGDQAAKQDVLVHTLGNERILRTKDAYNGAVQKVEIEDLLRETLVKVAKSELSWNVEAVASKQPARPVVEIFEAEIAGFSKYLLAKAFVRWTRAHAASDLTQTERDQWGALIENINASLS